MFQQPREFPHLAAYNEMENVHKREEKKRRTEDMEREAEKKKVLYAFESVQKLPSEPIPKPRSSCETVAHTDSLNCACRLR